MFSKELAWYLCKDSAADDYFLFNKAINNLISSNCFREVGHDLYTLNIKTLQSNSAIFAKSIYVSDDTPALTILIEPEDTAAETEEPSPDGKTSKPSLDSTLFSMIPSFANSGNSRGPSPVSVQIPAFFAELGLASTLNAATSPRGRRLSSPVEPLTPRSASPTSERNSEAERKSVEAQPSPGGKSTWTR